MRLLYTFLLYLALPFLFIRLWFKSRRLPAYKERWGERLGFYPIKLKKCLWVHAVSMGETLAAIPLIKALKTRYPGTPILVTTMTPTGAEQVKKAFGESVAHVYLPYDFPSAVNRFLQAMQPQVGIIMETELWPNLLFACRKKQIPICVLNGRLSEKSAQGYQRIAPLTRKMLQQIDFIAAHGQEDATRFIALGAPKDQVVVTGNIKFDLVLPDDLPTKSADLRVFLGLNRFIWIAASTHEGEEEIILAAHKKLRATLPQALLILVPRHPDRFNAVAALCTQSFPSAVARRSHHETCEAETAVYLGDTMGELLLLYAAADVAFVGGSLIPRGGHNMLEPAALSKSIVTGPHLYNFAEISRLLRSANALAEVSDAETLKSALIMFAQDQSVRDDMGKRALAVVLANRGALNKQLEIVNRIAGGVLQ